MSKLALNLRIKGDYIDSFIYSGVLYLLDTDLKFKSYKWDDICNFILERNRFRGINAKDILKYVKDNRVNNNNNKTIDTEINHKELKRLEKDSINIKYWPSDINLLSNKLYFSGDDGVYYIETHHMTAKFEKTSKDNKIFGTKSFSISPNSHMRIALAAGTEGVFTSCFKFDKIRPEEKQISKDSCIDIDWMNDTLFVNSDKLSINNFEKILQKKDIESKEEYIDFKRNLLRDFDKENKNELSISNHDYKKYLKSILNKDPEPINIKNKYKYGWSSGDCDFIIKNKNTILILNKITGNIKKVNTGDVLSSLLKVRTSGCGTIMESKTGFLYLINENNNEKISDDYVAWRVYPRAKNHAKHLHIVNDDNINIRVFNSDIISSELSTFRSKNDNDTDDIYKYKIQDLIKKIDK
ncbi:hypothetical protein NFF72_14670 [Proteus mirabilis]|uniref:hypothetical protein n=1 Tax=Proteus mirabilis TaxID=584 RepID=UPI0023F645B5|nr:hypothetical protein [Proteus mirabilis]MDF7389977.1 hypothetical protein [Proteus mirabilis]MDF7451074.1 hypothetical protein [Proteus mirabilis]MDM3840043.1 hypothetical protein [Proteus mirabilis]HEK2032671.1 hypothetical protein [Proteus mirabilis]